MNEPSGKLLACFICKGIVEVRGRLVICATCGVVGSLKDDIVILSEQFKRSYFDKTFQKMEKGKICKEDWEFYYERQVRLIEKHLRPGMVVLDVGCGPSSPYRNHCAAFIIGLETSYESIKFNHNVDLRVFGTATDAPFADGSVDAVICLYSIHHIIGKKIKENRALAQKCFEEFRRILKPTGMLFVFEDVTAGPFWFLQNLLWEFIKRCLPEKLDMFFYSGSDLKKMATDAGFELSPEVISFSFPPFRIITPVFAIRWLRMFRFMYPLFPKLYKWSAGHAA